jgi:hypothetical protein
MRKLSYLIAAILMIAFISTSCKSKKEVTDNKKKPQGEELITS